MNKRYMAIWFKHLKTDWMARHSPRLKNIPFALAYPDHGRLRITEVNRIAKNEGINAGLVVADAKVILPSLEVQEDDPELTKKILTMLCSWSIRFTPAAAIDLPDGLILDVTGCTHLWNGEENYLEIITTRLKNLGYHIRAGLADTVGSSRAIARYGKIKVIIPPGQQKEALAHLPPAALGLEEATLDRLHKLGFSRIGSFMDFGERALRRRFGSDLTNQLARAIGQKEERIEPLLPLEPWEERLPSLEPIQTRKGIEIALERLLESLVTRLSKEGIGIRVAVFKGLRIDGVTEKMSISTNLPSLNLPHLLKLFEIHLGTLNPASGIDLFSLTATKVQLLSPVQQSLWDDGNQLKCNELAQLLDRIQAKYGKDTLQRFLPAEHHMPERSVKRAASLQEIPEIPWRTDRRRPILLLQKPTKILVTAPVPDYPPMNFNYGGKLHKIKKADGPERIEAEWWLEQGPHRDYYVVENEEGKRFWLFRLGHYNEKTKPDWFLHGFFP